MSHESSASNDALARLKHGASRGSEHSGLPADADDTVAAHRDASDPSVSDADVSQAGVSDAGGSVASPSTGPHVAGRKDRVTLRDRLNSWLDSFSGPSQVDIEITILNTPQRLQSKWRKLQQEREATREADERAKQLAFEVEEARLALESRWAREAEEMAEMERRDAAEARRVQQERESLALLKAARELESDDIPAPENRPMLQSVGEYLNDDELLDRARQNLPEWQRLDRLVQKARAIEAQTPAPLLDAQLEDVSDEDIVLPFRKPVPDDPDPRHLDGFRRVTLSISWALFVAVGFFGLGWFGPWPSVLEVHDGLYSSSTTLLSMAGWHIFMWPVLWLFMMLYTVYQWAPSQYSAMRNRATAWYVANAMLFASGTILLNHFQDFGLEVITVLTALVLLIQAVRNLNRHTERTLRERFFVDFPIGLFTGWMLIFAATTLFTRLVSWNIVDVLWIPEIFWALVVVAILLVVLSSLALTGRGRISVAVGFGVGLAAIVVPRFFGENSSFALAGLSLLGLFIVVAATEHRRFLITTAEKQALDHLVYLDEVEQ